jgi:hypothetical protein
MADTASLPTTAPNGAAPSADPALSALVEEILKSKGVPSASAHAAGQDSAALIETAARKVPSWVPTIALIFGLPSVGSFVATAQSVWGMPDKVAAIEKELESQRALHAQQNEQLQRIEALIKVSHPASQPVGGAK